MRSKLGCAVSRLLTSPHPWHSNACVLHQISVDVTRSVKSTRYFSHRTRVSSLVTRLCTFDSNPTWLNSHQPSVCLTRTYSHAAGPLAPQDRNGFKVAVICALPLEANFVRALFDRHWDEEGNRYGKARGDRNAYSVGAIGKHNVVLAHMPGIGKASAAAVAADIRSSFPQIELALLVGVCGGVPFYRSQRHDQEIILGDVVISQALVQYDYGRRYYRDFKVKREVEDDLGRPFPAVRAFLAKLQTDQLRQDVLDGMGDHLAQLGDIVSYPGARADKLFKSTYVHKHHLASEQMACRSCVSGDTAVCDIALAMDCDELGCDLSKLVQRKRLPIQAASDYRPPLAVHFGRVASGDAVIKSGFDRDQIASDHKVIAFEMEAAGMWESFPCIVIKGVCDYADSHKNKAFQTYAAATAASCMKAVLREWSSGVYAEAVWHVPFEHVPGFVGRRHEIEQISRTLFGTNRHKRSAVFGLGGMGKSRLSLEIAHRAKQNMPGLSVFWIQATDMSSFEQDCFEIGCRLQIPGIDDEEADVKNLLKQHLINATDTKWLLVLDGADDESLWAPRSNHCWSNHSTGLGAYLPRSPNGSILVTSRSRRIAMQIAGRDMIELKEMSSSEAVETLVNLLINPEAQDDTESATELVRQLSCLPLAVVQAAAYINLNSLSISDYLDLLSAKREEDIIELLSEGFEDEIRYNTSRNAIATTWLISFEQLYSQHRVAADLLSYMACLHENDIPQSLLPTFSSRKEFVDAIGVLRGYSFIERYTLESSTEQFYEMHKLVRLATRNWLRNQNSLSEWVEDAMKRTAAILERVLPEAKEKRALYMSHTIALNSSKGLGDSLYRHVLMLRMAQHCEANGDIDESIKLAKSAALWMDSHSSSCDREKQEAYRVWGMALASRGDFSESAQLLEQVCDHHQRHQSTQTIEALKGMNNLGLVYTKLGKLDEAEEVLLKCIRTSKGHLDSFNDITLSSMSYLAWLYRIRGRLDEAEALTMKVLEASVMVPKFSESASRFARFTLASIYTDQGKYAEAESLLNHVIETRSTVYGPEHPKVMDVKHQLAAVYRQMGRLPLAESTQREVVSVLDKVLGPKALHTLRAKHSLGLIYKAQGRIQKARVIESLASKIYESMLGPFHRYTLTCKWSLAQIHWDLRHFARAIEMTREVMTIQDQKLGPKDIDTLSTMADLASMLAESGNPQAGLDMYNECIEKAKTSLGASHPLTLKCQHKHAGLLKRIESRSMHGWFRRLLHLFKRRVGRVVILVVVFRHAHLAVVVYGVQASETHGDINRASTGHKRYDVDRTMVASVILRLNGQVFN